jgi:hypothetical protein
MILLMHYSEPRWWWNQDSTSGVRAIRMKDWDGAGVARKLGDGSAAATTAEVGCGRCGTRVKGYNLFVVH